MPDLPSVALPSGERLPALGQGLWQIGDSAGKRTVEVDTLRRGLDLGMTVLDTAEMYGEGASERLTGEAISDRRDQVFLVSKVYPRNAGRRAMAASCEASLLRLGTDRLDLYLLHWRGSVPLAETVEGFEVLVRDGKVRHWGVSNFDVDDMEALWAAGGTACATNQILYNVTRRGPEFGLLPWMAGRRMPAMAYSPIEQGRVPDSPALRAVADRRGASVTQVMLAFAIRSGGVMAIPKASSVAHVEDNAGAAAVTLDDRDMAEIDAAFPPPRGKRALEML